MEVTFLQFFYEAMELMNPNNWKHDMFSYDVRSRSIFAKYKPTSHLDKNVESLATDPFIQKQLEHQQVDVDAIKSEWTSLKTIMSRWDKKTFLQQIGLH